MGGTLNALSLLPLVDALQIELELTRKDRILGKSTEVFKCPEIGLRIRMEPKVVSSRVVLSDIGSMARAYVLVHIRGDLHVLGLYDRRGGSTLHMAILDGSKLTAKGYSTYEFFEKRPDKSQEDDLLVLKEAIVASFEKSDSSVATEWSSPSLYFGA